MPGFRRTLKLESKEAPAHLWYRAAVSKKIEKLEDGAFKLENGMRLRFELPEGDAPTIRPGAGGSELLVPLKLRDGRLSIVESFSW